MSIPEGLKAWLKHSLTCIPLAGPKARMASQNSAPPRATGWTAELLQQLCDPPPSYSAAGYGKGYHLPPDWEVSQAKEVILRRVMGLRCACEGMRKEVDCTPSLSNATGHLVIRHPEQWEAVFGQTLIPIFTTNARNELLPSHDTVFANICSFSNSLKSLIVPQADLVSARLAPEGLLQHSAIQTVFQKRDEVYKVVWAQVKKEAEATPWMTEDTSKAACLYMRTLRLSGGCWDKFTHKQYAVCQDLMERRAVSDTLFVTDSSFGVGLTRR